MKSSVCIRPSLTARETARLASSLCSPGQGRLNAVLWHLRFFIDSNCWLRRRDYPRMVARLQRMDVDENTDSPEPDQNRVLHLANDVGDYGKERGLLTDNYYNLLALGYFLRGFDWQQIANALPKSNWPARHEILLRWGWMRCHEELLRKGANIKRPYVCRVAKRGTGPRTTDREFHQLLHFLHGLRVETGDELVFRRNRETPDFLLQDPDGRRLGAEMREIPLSQTWADEMDARGVVLDGLREAIEPIPIALSIQEPSSWRDLADQTQALREFVVGHVRDQPVRTQSTKGECKKLGVTIRSVPSSAFSVASGHCETGQSTDRKTQELIRSIAKGIESKVIKVNKSGTSVWRKPPGVRPCYLVLYPNTDLFELRLAPLVPAVQALLSVCVRSHFDQVWLSSEQEIVRVL